MTSVRSHYESASTVHRSVPDASESLDDRADHLLTSLQIATTDCQGLMRHVLDCLGALRVRAKVDHRMTPALRHVFKGACNRFLDEVCEEQDEDHNDGSAVNLLMNVFPDDSKRRDGRSWLPLHWAAALEQTDEEHLKSIARDRPANARATHECGASVRTLEQQAGVEHTPQPGLLPFHFITSLRYPRLQNMKTILSLFPDAVRTPDEVKGWLPLHFAAWNCASAEAVRFLLDIHQPAVYSQTGRGQLPFLLGMHNLRSEVLDELLEPNPDALDGCDRRGNSCAHYATRMCNPDAAKKVISLHPELATQKNFNEELPIHKALIVFVQRDDKRQRWKQLELLRIILDENPETVSQADKDGNLPLHLAVGFNASYEVCEAVFNVYPTAALLPDGDGNLPVHYCDPKNEKLYSLLFSSSKPLQKLGLKSSFAQFTSDARK